LSLILPQSVEFFKRNIDLKASICIMAARYSWRVARGKRPVDRHGNLLRKVPMPARKGNHEVEGDKRKRQQTSPLREVFAFQGQIPPGGTSANSRRFILATCSDSKKAC